MALAKRILTLCGSPLRVGDACLMLADRLSERVSGSRSTHTCMRARLGLFVCVGAATERGCVVAQACLSAVWLCLCAMSADVGAGWSVGRARA
jgi:hypothetical protein